MTLAVWVGGRVRDRRKELGMTQEELAACLERPQYMVSRWERGEISPSVPNLIKLADALNVSTDWLLGRDAIKLRY